MNRWMIVLGLAVALGGQALAQARPDFSGTWQFNQAESDPDTFGNSPSMPFPSEIVVRQTPTEFHVELMTMRQSPVSAVYKLDGSTVTVATDPGTTETGAAMFEGATMVITSRRAYPSPMGDIVTEFKETWSLRGNVLTIEKTRFEGGESTTAKGVFNKS